MRILVTGSDGYLGSLLTPELIRRGHEVTGLDTGFYKEGALYRNGPVAPFTLVKDLRHLEAKDFQGIDAVVHMGELSNDPTGELAPHITHEINHRGSLFIAELARKAGVKRFIYMSSCSVYGVADRDFVDEESPLNPQTAYAECKMLVERDLKPMATDGFSPTFLRNATAYGASPRMRFDLVINNLSGLAWTIKEIKMTSDGTPWRPLVHGLDIARAIMCVLDAPKDAIHNQIFNVGDTTHNYQVKQIAQFVAETFPGCKISFGKPGADNRSYRVAFDKIRKHLPDFRCAWDARKGVQQLYELFKRIDMSKELFEFRTFTRIKQLQHLLRTRQIDQNFFWTEK